MILVTEFDVSVNELMPHFESAPARLQALLRGLTRRQCLAGRWPIRERIIQLVDLELMNSARVRQLLTHPKTALAAFDQQPREARVERDRINASSFRHELELFSVVRLSTAAICRHAGDFAWATWAVHPEWGKVTLRQLLVLYTDSSEQLIQAIAGWKAGLSTQKRIPRAAHSASCGMASRHALTETTDSTIR